MQLAEKTILTSGVLIPDSFGNYVYQYLLESLRSPESTVRQLIEQLTTDEVRYCKMKSSSHVVEKCIVKCQRNGFRDLEEILERNLVVDERTFVELSQDRFSNYVIQRILNSCDDELLAIAERHVRANRARLQQS